MNNSLVKKLEEKMDISEAQAILQGWRDITDIEGFYVALGIAIDVLDEKISSKEK